MSKEMMFKELILENFKGFSNKQSIELKPITLIYGANSSGKSSILQSLLLLKQTLEQSNNKSVILLSKGKYIDLGNYNEFINAHDTKKNLRIKIKLPNFKTKFSRFSNIQKEIKNAHIEIVFSQQKALEIESYSLFVEDDLFMTLTRTSDNIETHRYFYFFPRTNAEERKENFNFEISSINIHNKLYKKMLEEIKKDFPMDLPKEKFTLALGRSDSNNKLYQAYLELKNIIQNDLNEKLNTEILNYYKKFIYKFTNFLPYISMIREDSTSILDDLDLYMKKNLRLTNSLEGLFNITSSLINDILDKMYYIGPLRKNPERYYISSGNVSNYVGKTGLESPDILYENENEILNTTNKWLKKFTNYMLKPISSTRNSKLTGKQNVYSLRLVDNITKMNVNITDVGFGISQILPIIVQTCKSKNSTILIEQPEIHIHPKLQAELGSMFAETCEDNMFIIETHSENLLLRLKKLVRLGKLDKDNLSIIYVDKDETGSVCYPIKLDENGDFIDKWPNGFFEEDMEELF